MSFWKNYWWVILLIILLLIFIIYFIWRWYLLHHINYKSEQRHHFPQWSNAGIITRDNYLLKTNYNFIESSQIIIIAVHSLGCAKEDFNKTKKYLNDKQISFLSFDQRNWGENSKWTYTSIGTTISDIEDIIKVLNERFPNKKIFLLGDSFGACLVSLALKILNNQLAGGILTNFPTKNYFKPTINSIFKIAFGFLFYKDIILTINYSPEDLSDSLEYIEIVNERNYRRNNKSFTLLYLIQTKASISKVVDNVNQSILPTLVIQSGYDIMADYNKVRENQAKFKKNVTYKIYKQGRHSILNDSHNETIFEDISQWLSDYQNNKK